MPSSVSASQTPLEPGIERELKFSVDDLRLARFLRAVDRHVALDVYDAARPVSYARTTYLDTRELDYYRSGDPGPLLRLRIREYAAAPGTSDAPVLTGLCFLELKQSESTERRKVRWSAPAGVVRTLVASAGLLPSETAVPAEIVDRLRADRPTPVAMTWYRRRSFAAAGVRITVDDPVWLCRPTSAGAPGLPAAPGAPVAVVPGKVLEVKLTQAAPSWLEEALQVLPAPRSASKFRLAVDALHAR